MICSSAIISRKSTIFCLWLAKCLPSPLIGKWYEIVDRLNHSIHIILHWINNCWKTRLASNFRVGLSLQSWHSALPAAYAAVVWLLCLMVACLVSEITMSSYGVLVNRAFSLGNKRNLLRKKKRLRLILVRRRKQPTWQRWLRGRRRRWGRGCRGWRQWRARPRPRPRRWMPREAEAEARPPRRCGQPFACAMFRYWKCSKRSLQLPPEAAQALALSSLTLIRVLEHGIG